MSDVETQIAEEMGDDKPETGDVTPDDANPETGGDAPGDAAPETTAPRSQKEIDTLTKKLEAEAERHAKRVAEIMGDDFALLVPSPVDWTPGFIFNVPEMHPDETALATLDAILGRGASAELLPAEDAEACPKCNALGEVLTGSRKDGQKTKPCAACSGTGWRTKLQPVSPPPAPPATTTNGTTSGYNINQVPIPDAWGRQQGHPHYGIPPAQVGV